MDRIADDARVRSEHRPTADAVRTDFHMAVPEYALEVMRALEEAGYEAWLVGGCVRDALVGRDSSDADVATDAHWTDVKRICEERGMNTYETGVKHGTLTVTTARIDGRPVEVTTYRADGAYSDGRHPDDVSFVRSIEEDLARRDFTINAMAFHPERGLLDPYGGRADIGRKTIRIVGEPEKRLREDGLRILRACRFASELGFAIEARSLEAMVASKHLLARVSVERITHELDRLLLGDSVHDALMQTAGVLAFVLPELAAMKGCEQRTKYHIYDVLEHTAWTVQYVPRVRLIRWAALCHDMGKPAAAFFSPDGVEHFYGHAAVSAKMAEGIADRLLMSKTFKAELARLVRMHDDVIEPNERSARRVLADMDGREDAVRMLLELKRADTRAHAPEFAGCTESIDEAEALVGEVARSGDAFSLGTLALNGDDLLAMGVPEGPEVGRLLHAALEEVIEGRLQNDRRSLIAFCNGLV